MRYTADEFIDFVRVNKPDAHAATNTGTGIDCKGYRQAIFFVDVGTIGTSVDFHIEESSDDGSSDAYADVTNASITQITASDKQAIIRVDLTKRERYLRGILEQGGTEDAAVSAVLLNADNLPVSQSHADEEVTV